MKSDFQTSDEFHEHLESLLQDVLLLDALVSRKNSGNSPVMRRLPPDFFANTQQRLMDYLVQHSTDLYQIVEYTEKAQDT